MTLLDWLIVLILNGAVIGYGLYLARSTETSSEWFLGGRVLPWWAIGLSMFATNVDSADIVSVTGNTFKEGVHILTVYSLGSIAGGILAAFVIVPTIYRAGFYTNAEYLEARFGPATRVLSALIQLQYRSSMLGIIIWSGHLLLTRFVELSSMQAWILMCVLVLLAGLYTAFGGLRSVVWTDAAQGIVMMLAALAIFCVVWNKVGGWEGMQAELARTGHSDLAHIGRYHGDDGKTPAWMVVIGWTVIGSGYWTVNHTQTMRLMGARSLWDMKMAALWGSGSQLADHGCVGDARRVRTSDSRIPINRQRSVRYDLSAACQQIARAGFKGFGCRRRGSGDCQHVRFDGFGFVRDLHERHLRAIPGS